ncbi:MAG: DNA-3-methyladenine glycosylase 2 family protein [Deltaproteobacteria bacterium]|nr:DNA-3-methyladenine glycosylase 2 family protein [Kofleriaceae bacterium]
MTYDVAAATAYLAKVEPRFAPLIERHGTPDLTPTRDPFQTLGRAIIYQQLAGAAAATIYKRFCAQFGGTRFPRPAALAAATPESLRPAGLSRSKALALIDLGSHFADGRVKPKALLTAPDADVSAMLLPIRGIGPWSVDMFAMFGLCRPDVWPVGDFGVRQGLQYFLRLRALPEGKRLERVAEPWRPWRSLAAWYMWRVVEDRRARPTR